MEKRLQEVYEDTFTAYQRLVSATKWATAQVVSHGGDVEYCADVGFAMKEIDKLLHDIGVEVRKTLELAEMLACRVWLRSEGDEPIRTEYCTASPRLKMQPAVPKKDTPELAELLDWLGMSKNHGAVRIHWPTLCDLVTQCVENGWPIPKCIDPSSLFEPEMKLTFLKKKDVTK